MTWLLVEDDSDIRNVVAVMMTVWGEKPLPFPDGNSAWAWLDSVANGTFNGELPSLALMDIRMPGYTGDKIASRIRQTAALKDIPIVLMTAFSLTEAEINAMREQAGIDHLINKPLPDMDVFRSTLYKVRDERRIKNATMPPAPVQPPVPEPTPPQPVVPVAKPNQTKPLPPITAEKPGQTKPLGPVTPGATLPTQATLPPHAPPVPPAPSLPVTPTPPAPTTPIPPASTTPAQPVVPAPVVPPVTPTPPVPTQTTPPPAVAPTQPTPTPTPPAAPTTPAPAQPVTPTPENTIPPRKE